MISFSSIATAVADTMLRPAKDEGRPTFVGHGDDPTTQAEDGGALIMEDSAPAHGSDDSTMSQSSNDDLQAEDNAQRRQRLRDGGSNVSAFAFSPKPAPPKVDPLNPQNFQPKTTTGKPRCTRPVPRVSRYFPSSTDLPTSFVDVHKAIHKALITKPTEIQRHITDVPPAFQVATPVLPSVERRRSSLNEASVAAAAAEIQKQSELDTSNTAFLTEAPESPPVRTSDDGMRPVDRMRSMGSVAMKMKRRLSRRRTLQDLEARLDVSEFDVFADETITEMPSEGSPVAVKAEVRPLQARSPLASSQRLEGSVSSLSPAKRDTEQHQARSLYSVALPTLNDDKEICTTTYPKGVTVETTVERVVAMEPANIRTHVDDEQIREFFASTECRKLFLGFFWHSVVGMRRRKLEDELLRANKIFEDAFGEVDPRSVPSVEKAVGLTSDMPTSEVDEDTLAFSIVYQRLSDQSRSRVFDADPSNDEAAGSDTTHGAGAQSGFLHLARKESLAVATSELLVARAHLAEAVHFEEAMFHMMAVNFGQAFRNIGKSAAKDLFPFERKEAVFGLLPTLAAHCTYFVMIQSFPNDFDANVFNKRFRRALLRRFSFWCTGVTLQHVPTGGWPTPIDDAAAHIATVLMSNENIVNGQYAVMKEFHKRAHHGTHVLHEWLRLQTSVGGTSATDDAGVLPLLPTQSTLHTGQHQTTGHQRSIVFSPPSGGGTAPSGPRSRSCAVGAGVADHDTHSKSGSQRHGKRAELLPTLHAGSSAWYEYGAFRGQLSAQREFEYGCAGATAQESHSGRDAAIRAAGGAVPAVPSPEDEQAISKQGAAQKVATIPLTSPFMTHYAKEVLSLDLKVVDLAGREAQPIHLTQLSSLDKFAVRLNFSGLATPRLAAAKQAVEDTLREESAQNQLAHRLQQESSHFRRIEESRLQYAERVISYHLSARNPECNQNTMQVEQLLREALRAPTSLVSQSTAQCQHALRCYRQVMFAASSRRTILQDLSIKVACKVRQLQRLRGDVWGANESTLPSRRKHSSTLTRGVQPHRVAQIVVDDVDVAHADFDKAITVNEFPLIGQQLDDVAESIMFHQWLQGAHQIRIDEEVCFTDLMSDFVRRHQRIFARDRSRYPLMRAAYVPFPVKEGSPRDTLAGTLSAEDRWQSQVIASNASVIEAAGLLTRGVLGAGEAAQRLKGLLYFDPGTSRVTNIFRVAEAKRDAQHVEQLRQRLSTEYAERHEALQSDLDQFVAATAIGRRGHLATPPDDGGSSRPSRAALSFREAESSRVLDGALKSPRSRSKNAGHAVPLVYQGSEDLTAAPPTPSDPVQILRAVTTWTPLVKQRSLQSLNGRPPPAPLTSRDLLYGTTRTTATVTSPLALSPKSAREPRRIVLSPQTGTSSEGRGTAELLSPDASASTFQHTTFLPTTHAPRHRVTMPHAPLRAGDSHNRPSAHGAFSVSQSRK